MALMYEKIKNILAENESRIVLFCGLILVSILSFEAGIIRGQKWQSSPIIVEKTASAQNLSSEGASGSLSEAQNSLQETKNGVVNSIIPAKSLPADKQNCAHVGSKNSNKYHLPTCRFAKLIKPENIVCFSSAEDATARGYLADKGCIK